MRHRTSSPNRNSNSEGRNSYPYESDYRGRNEYDEDNYGDNRHYLNDYDDEDDQDFDNAYDEGYRHGYAVGSGRSGGRNQSLYNDDDRDNYFDREDRYFDHEDDYFGPHHGTSSRNSYSENERRNYSGYMGSPNSAGRGMSHNRRGGTRSSSAQGSGNQRYSSDSHGNYNRDYSNTPSSGQGFASMSKDERTRIARKGGRASGRARRGFGSNNV